MTKQAEWVHNKQKLNTGHKTFDQQTPAICVGQVIGSTQSCHVVRAHSEQWNGNYGPVAPGHFQQWDLHHFWPTVPPRIRDEVVNLTAERSLFLHAFFTYNGDRRTVHGWVAVRFENDGRKVLLNKWVTGPTHRSHLVIDGALPYICDLEDTTP